MREAEVVFTNEFVVGDDIIGKAFVFLTIKVGHLAHGCNLNVHVVGSAPQHPIRGMSRDLKRPPSTQQIFLCFGNHVRKSDRLARSWRFEDHLLLQLGVVLQVVNTGKRARHTGELGMGRNIGHSLSLKPDLASVAQAFQELFSISDCHATPPCKTSSIGMKVKTCATLKLVSSCFKGENGNLRQESRVIGPHERFRA